MERPWTPLALLLLAAACSRETPDARVRADAHEQEHAHRHAHDELPPTARPELVLALREARDARRRSGEETGDGEGRAWLAEGSPRAVHAGGFARFEIVFEAGPRGVAEGGALLLQPSPFWGWSPPQDLEPRGEGYVTVASEAEGVELESVLVERGLLAIRVNGRALRAGERLRIVYGAGERGARVDRFAERGERLWLRVDADGDGLSLPLADSPTVDVLPGPPARLSFFVPSVVAPGARASARLALLDRGANAGVECPAGLEIRLELPEGLEGPERVALGPGALASFDFVARQEGLYRLRARLELAGNESGELVLEGLSNPLSVEHGPRVLWGDLHGHSRLSDGTGEPEDWLRYARDVAALDVAALTDHDHWGIEPLDEHPHHFERIAAATARFHEPGRFVTLLGYEWTSWIHGHRHVLHFADEGPLFSSLAEESDHPLELWELLRGLPALTFAHHSAGGPIATDWSIAPDPVLEPVTEVVSVHGVSEAHDAPWRIYSPLAGNFVRDALGKGYRLGFVGSGDGHDGHPGLTAASPHNPTGGLAAIIAPEATREAVLAALRARRCYATSGERILVRCTLAGRPMGSLLPASELTEGAELLVRVVGTRAIERVELVRGAEVAASFPGDGREELLLGARLEELRAGEFVYVRVLQVDGPGGADGGLAWTSPFFVE